LISAAALHLQGETRVMGAIEYQWKAANG
jgi:hypothetical protein